MQNRIIIDQTRPDHDHPIVRNSSFELLRIIAMLMIVSSHTNWGNFNFSTDTLSFNRLWQQFLNTGGDLANNIFVMLSGYFLINSQEIKLRKLLDLWARIFFYSSAIYIIFVISRIESSPFRAMLQVWADTGGKYTVSEINAFSLETIFQILMPITRGKGSNWWFAKVYFIMYLIHPYVNKLLHTFTKEEYRKFLLCVGIYWSIIPTLTNSDFGANNTINFVCIYSLAGYVRLYPEDFEKRNYIFYGLMFIGLNFLSVIVLDIISAEYSLAINVKYFCGMMRPFTILGALSLLLGFMRLNIQRSRIINTIASAAFGVYLIHENVFVRPFLWRKVFSASSFRDSPYLILYSTAVILTVYISCTLIELIRSKVFRTLSRGYLS